MYKEQKKNEIQSFPGEGLALPPRNKLTSKGSNPATVTLGKMTQFLQITALKDMETAFPTCQDVQYAWKPPVHILQRKGSSLL